jgi:hypothetical protein
MIDMTGNIWVLGNAFIQEHYTVFDMEQMQMGFGQLEIENVDYDDDDEVVPSEPEEQEE